MAFKNFLVAGLFLAVLSGCGQEGTTDLHSAEVKALDEQLLPNNNWQLSRATIELSFCRNRINEALLASEAELRGWRLSGESTAFPPHRSEGINALSKLFKQTDVLLWQAEGNVSAQRYHLVKPAKASKGEVVDAVFPAVVSLSAIDEVCHAAVDDSEY
ncbi:UNVERIFIED_ORG: hypothetical protein DFO82_0909 [Idiomarina abyssalis]|jgi:hypothetical protein|uniref:Predicted secreted protein n=1 Tax=Idiomarina loihiensis (strain ATCC BAA-735 / DSM 15497 / L2-TR) TaxID=283942 RepID=Q5QYR4_IDILO|nr:MULTISPECIES: hypothetical protein [Idiomarina]AAV81893.1 Predicted secreted protein [Idiomarina loihiensis L2TR]AGM35923.1 hypothetical protein K734_05295 [Idiomarina loihiensis GSL 199]TDO53111.1 hypothetical protein DEU30_101129 [Idiomarina sp. 017G]|tara:strand:- start:71 stop:547 length:477 start_codon:yes stop_codon:yes gene_type:complete